MSVSSRTRYGSKAASMSVDGDTSATPRTLLETFVQTHRTEDQTERKKPRLSVSYGTERSRTPAKKTRRRSLNTSLQKQVVMKNLTQQSHSSKYTPRGLISGFISQAPESTPVVIKDSENVPQEVAVSRDTSNTSLSASSDSSVMEDTFLAHYGSQPASSQPSQRFKQPRRRLRRLRHNKHHTSVQGLGHDDLDGLFDSTIEVVQSETNTSLQASTSAVDRPADKPAASLSDTLSSSSDQSLLEDTFLKHYSSQPTSQSSQPSDRFKQPRKRHRPSKHTLRQVAGMSHESALLEDVEEEEENSVDDEFLPASQTATVTMMTDIPDTQPSVSDQSTRYSGHNQDRSAASKNEGEEIHDLSDVVRGQDQVGELTVVEGDEEVTRVKLARSHRSTEHILNVSQVNIHPSAGLQESVENVSALRIEEGVKMGRVNGDYMNRNDASLRIDDTINQPGVRSDSSVIESSGEGNYKVINAARGEGSRRDEMMTDDGADADDEVSQEDTEVSQTEDDVYPGDNDVSPDDNEVSPTDNEVSPVDKEASPDDKKASPDDNEVSRNDQVSQSDDEVSAGNEVSTDDGEVSHIRDAKMGMLKAGDPQVKSVADAGDDYDNEEMKDAVQDNQIHDDDVDDNDIQSDQNPEIDEDAASHDDDDDDDDDVDDSEGNKELEANDDDAEEVTINIGAVDDESSAIQRSSLSQASTSLNRSASYQDSFGRLARTPKLPQHKSPVSERSRLTRASGVHSAQNSQTKPRCSQVPSKSRKPRSSRLPSSLTKGLFSHFSQRKLSKPALEELEKIGDEFWRNVSEDLTAYAHHAKRSIIDEADVELLMKRQRFITSRESMYRLVEKHLPLEYRQEIIPMATAGNKIIPKL